MNGLSLSACWIRGPTRNNKTSDAVAMMTASDNNTKTNDHTDYADSTEKWCRASIFSLILFVVVYMVVFVFASSFFLLLCFVCWYRIWFTSSSSSYVFQYLVFLFFIMMVMATLVYVSNWSMHQVSEFDTQRTSYNLLNPLLNLGRKHYVASDNREID